MHVKYRIKNLQMYVKYKNENWQMHEKYKIENLQMHVKYKNKNWQMHVNLPNPKLVAYAFMIPNQLLQRTMSRKDEHDQRLFVVISFDQ